MTPDERADLWVAVGLGLWAVAIQVSMPLRFEDTSWVAVPFVVVLWLRIVAMLGSILAVCLCVYRSRSCRARTISALKTRKGPPP